MHYYKTFLTIGPRTTVSWQNLRIRIALTAIYPQWMAVGVLDAEAEAALRAGNAFEWGGGAENRKLRMPPDV